jgi:glycerol kinase
MSSGSLILAIDQGTTSTRAIVFDEGAEPLGTAQLELRQIFPRPGWVEHDPTEIADSAIEVGRRALKAARVSADDVAALGITNQGETTILWEAATGRPLSNAIVWQDRRTVDFCNELSDAGLADEIWSRTGLIVDPYFSATKMRWMLDHLPIPNLRARADNGDVRFGTVDAWLIDRFARGSNDSVRDDVPHLTDVTNASRTMLLNIHDLAWDPDLLEIFGIPEAALPLPLPSAGAFATTHPSVFGREMPIAGVAGDQHAALYGQACFTRGDMKCTYGTGAFLLANSGAGVDLFPSYSAPGEMSSDDLDETSTGLLFAVGWQVGGSKSYALEASIFNTGSTMQWLRDGLGLIGDVAESSDIATMLGENGGVYLVPAFSGLGSPHWDPHARASISGISRGTGREHIIRAALESTAYQVKEVVDIMDSQLRLPGRGNRRERVLRVDGGQTRNPFLMQFQSDLLDRPIEVSAIDETTALGVAFFAGRAAGIWRTERELAKLWRCARRYEPDMGESERIALMAGWSEALRRTKTDFRG